MLTERDRRANLFVLFLTSHSLRIGFVPDEWKLANIVAVYKHGEKTEVENYRPISRLPFISNTLERCVLNNITHHVYEQVNPCQNGFGFGGSILKWFGSYLINNGPGSSVKAASSIIRSATEIHSWSTIVPSV